MYSKMSVQNTIPHRFTFADDENPLLGVYYSYRPNEESASDPKPYCSIQIDANGSDDSKLIVLVNLGADSTDYEQYQFSSSASGITDPDGNDESPTHTQCTTLGALITALNALEGLHVYRLHAPSDLSIDSDDFIDLAKTQIGGIKQDTKILYRDASELAVFYGRIGGGATHSTGLVGGDIELAYLAAKGNVDSGTVTLKVETDPDETDTSNMETVFEWDDLADDTLTEKIKQADAAINPPVVPAPILITLSGTGLAANAVIQCNTRKPRP